MTKADLDYWRGYLDQERGQNLKPIPETEVEKTVQDAIWDWNTSCDNFNKITEEEGISALTFAKDFHKANNGIIDKEVIQAYVSQCV